MRIILVFVLFSACSKPNPGLCSEGDPCEEGLVCRGNQCIAVACESSAQCDASAPYCIAELERCQELCTGDNQCPGFGQSADQQFCVDGTCSSCRAANDCDVATPVCDVGACRICRSHDECSSGVCTADGSCATLDSIAHVSAGGSTTSDCTEASPCMLQRALALLPGRPYLLLRAGAHQTTNTVTLAGIRHLIGEGQSRPTISNSLTGPIFRLSFASEITFENLEITGARSGPNGSGNGIEVADNNGGAKLRLLRTVLSNHDVSGVNGDSLVIEASETTFRNNLSHGVRLIDSRGTFERCSAFSNAGAGLFLDAGLYVVRNSFLYRNQKGIEIFPSEVGNVIEFTTIADNTNVGIACISDGISTGVFPNNILARNTMNTVGASCTYPSSHLVGSDVSGLRFLSPNTAPFDYHIMMGSIAIDAAGPSDVMVDFDGDPRPSDAADVGADEL